LILRPYAQRDTVVAAPTDLLVTAYNRMKLYDVSQLPVMDGEKIAGIIDESDLLLHVYGDEKRFLEPVSTAMITELQTLAVNSPIEDLPGVRTRSRRDRGGRRKIPRAHHPHRLVELSAAARGLVEVTTSMHSSAPPLDQLPASEEAAIWAYRLILGREPESAAMVHDHVRQSESLQALRERFLECSEFTQRYRTVERERGRNVSVFPPCAIQTQVDAETGARLFQHVARSWRRFGNTEPYWSVMSEPQYLMEHIGQSRAAFLESGRENVERLLATLRRNGVAPDPQWEVLELGCGLGRNTRWLTPLFRRIFAVDVSSSH